MLDNVINLFVSEVTNIIVLVLAGSVAGIAIRSYGSVTGWLRNKRQSTRNNVLNECIGILQKIVESTVAQAEQTMVAKNRDGNEELSPELASKARTFVIETVKNNVPNDTVDVLKKYGVNLDSLIITFIEQTVLNMKKQCLVPPSDGITDLVPPSDGITDLVPPSDGRTE
ncbi:MAG: hypothetical protein QG588_174 [Candidatus Poribacteria bacterium]|nr:hypothetical protein [Candidatus Poribacteria bacterium]